MRPTLLAALLLIPHSTLAYPKAGETLPSINAHDVTDANQELPALLANRERTLLVAITDRGGGDAMRAWFKKADQLAPASNRVSILSLDLPFFVSDNYARNKARQEVPERWWSQTLMDTDQKLAKALDLQDSKTPYEFVLDASGKVLASIHANVNGPGGEAIWQALSGTADAAIPAHDTTR